MLDASGPKRLESLQALRGFAALAVFSQHLVWMEKLILPQRLLPRGAGFGAFGVDVFFALSGFIMVHTTTSKGVGARAAGDFLASRWTRIFPAYWAVLIPCFVIAALLPGWLSTEPAAPWLSSLLLLPAHEKPLVETGWTLVHELYFYSVFACLLLVERSKLGRFLAFWAVAVMLARMLWPAGVVRPAVLDLASNPLTLEFIAGAFVALLVRAGVQGHPRLALGIGLVGLVAGQGALQLNPTWLGSADLSRPLTVGVAAVLTLYGVAVLRPRAGRLLSWLVTVGDYSYALYLTHLPIIMVSAHVYAVLAFPAYWSNVGYLITSVLASILATRLLRHCVELPALAWSRAMLNRSSRGSTPAPQSATQPAVSAQGS